MFPAVERLIAGRYLRPRRQEGFVSVIAAFVSANYGPTWSPVTFYLALFLILLFRPQGLLGKRPEM